MNIFMSGSEGFIGRHLVKRLESLDHIVWGNDIVHGHGGVIAGISGFDYIMKMFSFNNDKIHEQYPDVYIHLAANIVNVDKRHKMGLRAYDDITLDLAFCKHVEKYPPRKAFIVMSSCAVDNPQDPYGVVKQNLESFAMKLHHQGVPVVILRPFSGYGPGQSLEYPFPAIAKRAIERQDPLVVWGGNQIRDWLYIDDLVDAIIHSIDHFPRGIPIEIGTGIGTSVSILARMISRSIDHGCSIVGEGSKESSSPSRIADPRLAKSYGWESKISLKDGIEKYICSLKL